MILYNWVLSENCNSLQTQQRSINMICYWSISLYSEAYKLIFLTETFSGAGHQGLAAIRRFRQCGYRRSCPLWRVRCSVGCEKNGRLQGRERLSTQVLSYMSPFRMCCEVEPSWRCLQLSLPWIHLRSPWNCDQWSCQW